MNDEEIRKILAQAITNNSGSSEKISDKVTAASTLFIANTLEGLSKEIKVLKNSIEIQAGKITESNDKLFSSTEYYAKWTKRLTVALIFVTLLVGLMQSYVAFMSGAVQNDISKQLLGLEEITKEPMLLVSLEEGILSASGNFSGKLRLRNAGPVPIHDIKYGASDFNSGSWKTSYEATSSTPTHSDIFHKGTVHLIGINVRGILAPGEEMLIPLRINRLEAIEEIPSVWLGVTFTRHPSGSQKCIELNYVPLKEYQELPNYSTECGPWWNYTKHE
jgi:hypothetical protein